MFRLFTSLVALAILSCTAPRYEIQKMSMEGAIPDYPRLYHLKSKNYLTFSQAMSYRTRFSIDPKLSTFIDQTKPNNYKINVLNNYSSFFYAKNLGNNLYLGANFNGGFEDSYLLFNTDVVFGILNNIGKVNLGFAGQWGIGNFKEYIKGMKYGYKGYLGEDTMQINEDNMEFRTNYGLSVYGSLDYLVSPILAFSFGGMNPHADFGGSLSFINLEVGILAKINEAMDFYGIAGTTKFSSNYDDNVPKFKIGIIFSPDFYLYNK